MHSAHLRTCDQRGFQRSPSPTPTRTARKTMRFVQVCASFYKLYGCPGAETQPTVLAIASLLLRLRSALLRSGLPQAKRKGGRSPK
jgi:hypothetical protein